MLSGTLYTICKRLNPAIQFCMHESVYAMKKRDYAAIYYKGDHICGVHKGSMPEYTIRGEHDRIIARGWRDIVNILDAKKIIKKEAFMKEYRNYAG